MNWKRYKPIVLLATLFAGLSLIILPASPAATGGPSGPAGGQVAQADTATVTIEPEVEYQTILGWGATAPGIQIPDMLREEILDEAVNDLGLTRLRLEPPGGNRSRERRWEWTNDNGDPDEINWSAFNTEALDKKVLLWVKPFKERVEANGDPFNLYISPSFFDGGSTGSAPAWLLQSPGEYAEFAISLILHLKNKHNITANYFSILNEAGNNNPFTPEVLSKMIKTLGPKLEELKLPTKIEFPECVNANEAWRYIQAVQGDDELWKYVGVITYHLYGSKSHRPKIYQFAKARGLPTGQTEYMGTSINNLYADLLLGGVSYWEHYVLAGYGNIAGKGNYLSANFNMTSFSRYREYWNFRQVMHYVRPGAVRVKVVSDERFIRPLAFVHNGKVTVVLLNNLAPSRERSVTVKNLPAGKYGLCQSVRRRPYQELGIQTVSEEGTLTVNLPQYTILTIYPYAGENQPPTVTGWRATPNYLSLPRSVTTLSALATDPELDALSYVWSVESKPAAANVILVAPQTARTEARGLTAPGDYIFAVAVSDAAHTVLRKVKLTVFAENQPPVLDDVHNRIPVVVTLPQSTTILRGVARDLEGDPFKFRWSVVSQPRGAKVKLETPDKPGCKLSNIAVPGDYVFQFQVSDPTHTVRKNLRVTVYPVNEAPVIEGAGANPASLTLPESRTSLSARASDPDGDVITHWWSVKESPVGGKPVFEKQGSPNTAVSGLTVPGTYVFTLAAIDRTKFASENVTVTVSVGQDT